MIKKIFLVVFVIIIIGGVAVYFLGSYEPPKTLNKEKALKTFEAINLYANALIKTDEFYAAKPSQISFEDWQKQGDDVLKLWEELDQKTATFEKELGLFFPSFSPNVISSASAYSAEEISAITDSVSPNKRIKTLMGLLNVDSKRAFKILQNSQNQMEAKAWNEEGDTMEKLENGAKTIKNGCKVGLFVGGIAMGGGATKLGEVGLEVLKTGVAKMGLIEKAVALVGGADLLLEIGDDTANVALGYNNDASVIIGETRKFTAPVAAISGLLTAPTETGQDAFNFIMMGADQLNSLMQNNQILGIDLPKEARKNPQATALNSDEVEQWLEENNISDKPVEPVEIIQKNIENIGLAADFSMPKTKEKTETKTEIKKEAEKTEGTNGQKIIFTTTDIPSAKQKGSSVSLSGDSFFEVIINSDNSISGSFNVGESNIGTAMGKDSDTTYASYDSYSSGKINGKYDPSSKMGTGDATVEWNIEPSNGKNVSTSLCPNATGKAKDDKICTFTLSEKDGKFELRIIYGVNNMGFTVSN